MSEFAVRAYTGEGQFVVAACDRDLLGKKFKEGKLVLNITEDYYADSFGNEEFLKDHLAKCTIGSLVGDRAVQAGIDLGLVDPDAVLKVEGIPHAQVLIL